MTRGEWAAAAAAVLGAAAVIGWQTGGFQLNAKASLTADANAPQPDELGDLVARGHVCGDVPGLHARHPLHRRHDGHAMRAALTSGGWAWFLDPPAEAAL